jgi:hypothetical protein
MLCSFNIDFHHEGCDDHPFINGFHAADSEHSKPKVGTIFDSLTDVEKFYKSYAHDNGFGVRVGQHKKGNEAILFKRYYCAREGYRKESVKDATEESGKKEDTVGVLDQQPTKGSTRSR